jgi:hypothetical protein
MPRPECCLFRDLKKQGLRASELRTNELTKRRSFVLSWDEELSIPASLQTAWMAGDDSTACFSRF